MLLAPTDNDSRSSLADWLELQALFSSRRTSSKGDLLNAFAAPGGYIYVTRGILVYLNSEAQLVGVVGHEIGHVTVRYYAQMVSR